MTTLSLHFSADQLIVPYLQSLSDLALGYGSLKNMKNVLQKLNNCHVWIDKEGLL
jgi:hypothetical protein